MRAVEFHPVVSGLDRPERRRGKLFLDLPDLPGRERAGALRQLLYWDADRTGGDRVTDPVAAGVIELDKGFAATLVNGVGEPPMFADQSVGRERELPFGGASALRDAAVLRDDDPRAAEDGAIPVIPRQLLCDMTAIRS